MVYNTYYRNGKSKYRGVEQLVARRAHNPKVVGSSPASATKKPHSPLVSEVFLRFEVEIGIHAFRVMRSTSGARWATTPHASGGRCSKALLAQRSKFVCAPSR